MKIEVTEAIVSNEEGVVATVSLVDDVAVKIDVRQHWPEAVKARAAIAKAEGEKT